MRVEQLRAAIPRIMPCQIVILSVLAAFILLSASTVMSQTYGDHCKLQTNRSTSSSCLQDSGLVCRKGICDCVYRWMVFRVEEGKCVSTVGRSCDHVAGSGGCVENSSCYKHICVCDPGHIQVSARTCTDPLANSGVGLPIICCSVKTTVRSSRTFASYFPALKCLN